MNKLRSFSAVQPTGLTHIGNYIGAIQQWVKRQEIDDNIYCIVDLHAFTVADEIDPNVLKARIREIAMLYLACGLDPEKNIIFVQSHVKEHSELCWILNCVSPMGWLERMTQYKSKAAEQKSVSTGLFDYPVLMAADILLYDTDIVPVGDDQKQHVEFCRDLAQRFNHLFGDVFKIPEHRLPKTGARIMGLDNPENKMSKSEAVKHPGHSIGLLDDENTIRKAIARGVTDNQNNTCFASASPGVLNLLTIYKSLTGLDKDIIEQRFEGKGYGYLKSSLFEVVMDTLLPIQEDYGKLKTDLGSINIMLERNADRARSIATRKMDKVRSSCGLG